ncbi:MAG TPA: hypothetical protein VFN23_00160 [Ktedonobacteraceae bacterium]|nr:hypothetical protein [Ktedonobacteraceae bacterium]
MVSTSTNNINFQTIRTRVEDRQFLRQGFLDILFPLIRNPYTNKPNASSTQLQVLNDLASSFSRYAGNQRTAFDNGTSTSSNGYDSGTMTRQVEQAFNKVLGGSYGSNPGGFVNALNSVFPTLNTPDGPLVSFKPSRSLIWLNGSNGNGVSSNGGFSGQLPARQATLYRQASTVVADSLQVLAGLKPFVPEADLDQVEALRSQIRAEINALFEEFGRVDEPRPDRVNAYFNTLGLHVTQFGRRSFLDNPSLVATDDDEAQTASFSLLRNYANTLRSTWLAFYNDDQSSSFFSLSERVERATIVLPVIAQANTDFKAAMDSVDFTESDRRSTATKFSDLTDFTVTILGIDVSLEQPDMTVYDLTEWLDRFSNNEGPGSLADSGQYGLDFVSDQSDTLFWIIAPIIGHFRTIITSSPSASGTTLEQVFSNERVVWSLNNLLTQLHGLANLSVPGEKRNSIKLKP